MIWLVDGLFWPIAGTAAAASGNDTRAASIVQRAVPPTRLWPEHYMAGPSPAPQWNADERCKPARWPRRRRPQRRCIIWTRRGGCANVRLWQGGGDEARGNGYTRLERERASATNAPGARITMAPLDSGPWLAAVSDELPAGPNLEFDADFGALERAAQGKPEQQYGDTIIPAEEPDWKEVGSLALTLLDRTRDLRVLAHFAVARLHLAGLAEFAGVLQLIRQLLESRWADIHPQLDTEDDNDPTLRANALLRVAHPGLVLRYLRDMPLASSPRVGNYSWRDVAIATGVLESDAKEKPTEAVVAFRLPGQRSRAAARAQKPPPRTQATRGRHPRRVDTNSGPGTGPDFDELVKILKDLGRTIDRYAAMPAAAPDQITPDDAGGSQPRAVIAGETPSAPRPGLVTVGQLTEVTNRADALRLLDLVTQYYQRFEPSSPLPLLIERARRLAEKNFLEVLRDLAPSGVDQAQIVVGPPQ